MATFAHQPRLNENTLTQVSEPEISKAYYGRLDGGPHVYRVESAESFELYVNVLVPDLPGQKKEVSAVVSKVGAVRESVAILEASKHQWKQFFEPFGHDTYWMGPEFRKAVMPGVYEIEVFSPQNDSKYSLAIGEAEDFGFSETMSALRMIPKLKRDFFEKSPMDFLLSPFGFGLVLVMFALSFVSGLAYRFILRRLARGKVRKSHHNIGKSDRWARAGLSIALFLWAITTSWSPVLLFFSGFTLFEAMFSWCGFYAAIGKSTCPLR